MKKVTIKIPKSLIFIVAFIFFAIIIRLSYVALSQKVDGTNLHELASNRNTKSEIIYAKRGNIYTASGDLIASTVNSYTLIAYLDKNRTTNESDPQHVVDKEKTAKALNEVLGVDYDHAIKQLNQNAYQVEFKGAKELSESDKNKIEELNLPGIDFIKNQKRNYNIGQFASYIVGYAKKKNGVEDGEIIGELGIESFYNDELSGINGKTEYETDAYGYKLPNASEATTLAVDGDDIYLTLDRRIQLFAETLTKNLDDNYDMDWMIFTVMDAKTGAIIASSTSPNFNPNDLNTLSDYKNPLVTNQYEPGSVMKIFSWATAIELGVYDGSKEYNSGTRVVEDKTIRDHNNGQGWGKITFDEGFIKSSNVAASYVADEVGKDKLLEYYKKLGFGSKTGIELANESKGVVNFKYQIEYENAAFGQGVSVTPIQMLQALSTLTNDGVALKPYIVSKIVDSEGNVKYEGKREEVAKVYSKETVDYMKNLMYQVVNDSYWEASKTTVIGKTGTAQIASPSGGYLKGKNDYVRSFAGIFPKDDPKYIVYVAAKQINTGATSIAKELTKAIDDIVSYSGIEDKTDEIVSKTITLDNYLSKDVDASKEELTNKNLNVYKLGTGKYVIDQYPSKNTKVLEGSRVFLLSNNNEYTMENIIGWSTNEVRTYASLIGLQVEYIGSGFVTSQSIEAGTPLNKEMKLSVTLSK